jgi:hypothetical protein
VNVDDARDGKLRVNTDVAPPNDVGDHVSETDEFGALAPVSDFECDGDRISGRTDAPTSTLVIWTRSILATSLTLSMRRLLFGTLPLVNPN